VTEKTSKRLREPIFDAARSVEIRSSVVFTDDVQTVYMSVGVKYLVVYYKSRKRE
jgi:hypothetical protein